jgi:hypothetical protein
MPSRLITRWANQAGEPPALSAERARLDARDFADLLAEAAHLAGLVGFQEGERLIGGDWRRVLAADPTIVLALLATVDVDGRSEGLQALIARARGAASPAEAERLLGRLLDGLLRFAAELDLWLAPAEAGAGIEGDGARRLIEESIEQVLGPQLRALLGEIAAAEQAGLIRGILPAIHNHRLGHLWRLAAIEAEAAALRHAVERAWIDRLLDQVAEVAKSFVNEVREIAARSAAALGPSLASGRHPGHVALIMAFARIFRHAQDRLNEVPQRIARFYQEEVLRDAPRGARPDSVLLTVAPRPGARPVIDEGTLFAAGKDGAGRPIGFAADGPLEVTGAILVAARLWAPARDGDGKVVRVGAATFDVGADGAVGDPARGMAGPGTAVAVKPGAVFASPGLRLDGGARRIVLAFASAGLDPAVTPAMLGACLGASLSTAAGWLDVENALWQRWADAFALTISLAADAPALAPCPAGTPDAPAEAALRLVLRQDAAGVADPWALFAGVTLAGATLHVAVKDVPGLTISTPTGPASTEGAAPFGSPPAQGGWLRVDHPILAGPPLDRLLLRFDWTALPPGPGGFEGWYHDYLVDAEGQVRDFSPFTNAVFTATLDAPVPGWDAARRLPLFVSVADWEEAAGPVAPAPSPSLPDVFAADFDTAPRAVDPWSPLATTSWFAAAATGAAGPVTDHVQVTLADPPDGFGDAVYPASVAYAAQRIAEGDVGPRRPSLLGRIVAAILGFPAWVLRKLGWLDDPEDEDEARARASANAGAALPNPPFRPLLSHVGLDIALSVAGADLTLFHVWPLEGLGGAAPIAGSSLFAPLPDRPAIDLAFAGARPRDLLSLLLRLGPPAGEVPVTSDPPAFSYLTESGWRPLRGGALAEDGSFGLTATGILRFAWPADSAPVGEGGWLWLRIVPAAGAALPAILAATPDALSATRMIDESGATFVPIPPGAIAGLPGAPGIAAVAQPLPSAGGRPAEAPEMLRRRVAERVRHRGRGLSGWDIERLALSEFPGIARIRVIAADDPAVEGPGGDVRVIVVPAEGGADPPDPARPRASPALRGALARRLSALTSPFARLHVVDPHYVALDVTAELVVRGDSADAPRAALAALLSPWAAPGLDLDDLAGEEAIRAAIASYLLALPDVVAIERLSVALDDSAAPADWRVPVAGALNIVAIAAERASLPW